MQIKAKYPEKEGSTPALPGPDRRTGAFRLVFSRDLPPAEGTPARKNQYI
jgi:hypothetical protein